jgi:hypothetical protein
MGADYARDDELLQAIQFIERVLVSEIDESEVKRQSGRPLTALLPSDWRQKSERGSVTIQWVRNEDPERTCYEALTFFWSPSEGWQIVFDPPDSL